MTEKHKKAVLDKIAELNKYMEKMDYKICYYKSAIDAGQKRYTHNNLASWIVSEYFQKYTGVEGQLW